MPIDLKDETVIHGLRRAGTEWLISYSEQTIRLVEQAEVLAGKLFRSTTGVVGGALKGEERQSPADESSSVPVPVVPLPVEAPLTGNHLSGAGPFGGKVLKATLLAILPAALFLSLNGKFVWPSWAPYRPNSFSRQVAERPG